jgi:hypothetical protein
MEELRLWLVESRVARRLFGLKRRKVMEAWRKLHKEELHNFYSSSGTIRRLK